MWCRTIKKHLNRKPSDEQNLLIQNFKTEFNAYIDARF